MTGPADRVRRCSKGHSSDRAGSRSVQYLTGRVGLGRVGSRGCQISRVRLGLVKIFSNLTGRVGSGRVKKCANLTGRVRSGQEETKSSRVGSGHDPRETAQSRVGPARPVTCFLLTRGSGPRHFEKLPSFCPKASLASILNSTILVSLSDMKTPPDLQYTRMSACIHTHYSMATYHHDVQQ